MKRVYRVIFYRCTLSFVILFITFFMLFLI